MVRARRPLARPVFGLLAVVGAWPLACNCDDDLNDIECGFTVEPSGPDAPIDFGEVEVGGERARTLRITNDGTVGLAEFEFRFSERNGDHYRVAMPPDFSIDIGTSETLSVVFAPLAESTNLGSSFTVSHPAVQGVSCGAVNVVVDGDGFAPFVPADGGVDDAGLDAGPDGGVDAGDVDGGEDGGALVDAGVVTPPDAGVEVGPNAQFVAQGALQEGRMGFAAVVLDDGSILVVGGVGPSGEALDSVERYDPATGRAAAAGTLRVPRAFAGAARLPSGRVAIVGGLSSTVDGVPLTTVELWDPAAEPADAVTCVAGQGQCGLDDVNGGQGLLDEGRLEPLVVAHTGAEAFTVLYGRVVDGLGVEVPAPSDPVVVTLGGTPQATVVDLDLAPRAFEARAVCPDGRVLVAGGLSDVGTPVSAVVGHDPAAVTTVELGIDVAPRLGGALACLAAGDALLVGGVDEDGALRTDVERLVDPFGTPDVVALASPVLQGRIGGSALALQGDLVVVAGGTSAIPADAAASVVPLTSAEVLVPLPGESVIRLNAANALAVARHGHQALVVDGGAAALFIGGSHVVPRRIGHPSVERYVLEENAFVVGGLMGPGTALETAAWTPGGGVLAAGGIDPHTGAVSARVRLYDAETDAYLDVPPLAAARRDHTVTRLADDVSYLVVGGRDPSGQVLASASIYSPLLPDFDEPLPVSLVRARADHSATLLDDGRVLVCGGTGALGEPLDTCELFAPPSSSLDPGTYDDASFSQTSGRMSAGRFAHTATRLETGEVLLVGGGDVETDLVPADLFSPDTDRVDETGVPALARRRHAAVYLGSGRVLVVGGETALGGLGPTATAEIYERQNEVFVDAGEELTTARIAPAAFLLAGGSVLVVGGGTTGQGAFPTRGLATAELFMPGPFGPGVFDAIDIPLTFPRADVVGLDVYGRAVVAAGTSRDGLLGVGSERRTPLFFVERLVNP